MTDRIYNIAQMLQDARRMWQKAKSEEERHFFDVEIYKWKSELLLNNVNPDSIDEIEFKYQHGGFDKFPTLKQQAFQIITSKTNNI